MSQLSKSIVHLLGTGVGNDPANAVAPFINHATRAAGDQLQEHCYGDAFESGWWHNLKTGEPLYSKAGEPPKINVPEKLCLIHSEVSEAMEGYRKNLADDKLPHRSMLEVELADAVIRCFDLAGGLGLDLGSAIAEKLQFNAQRQDHKPEHRRGAGGKAF